MAKQQLEVLQTNSGYRQRRDADELRYRILKACLHAGQSTTKLVKALNTTNHRWVKRLAMKLTAGGFLSVRVVHNGGVRANVFRTTPRGEELMNHLKAFR